MTRLHSAWLSGVIACAALTLADATQAQVAGKTQQARTQETSTQNVYTQMDDRDRLLGQIWGLTNEEMIRAKVLLEGPRKSFSVENLSPIEALACRALSTTSATTLRLDCMLSTAVSAPSWIRWPTNSWSAPAC